MKQLIIEADSWMVFHVLEALSRTASTQKKEEYQKFFNDWYLTGGEILIRPLRTTKDLEPKC